MEVLAYLWTEQLESWKESTSPWVVEGYALTTHPDLCERVVQIRAGLRGQTEMKYLFGKPALLTRDGVIVAFASGTYVFCVRLRREDCAPELIGERREPLSRFPVLRRKQLELEALTAGEWTRLDPWANDVVRHVEKAVGLL